MSNAERNAESEAFNPADKFVTINRGQHYLEVKWRVVWLRDDAPDSQIRSEHVVLNDQLAVFKATVTRIVDGEIRGVGEAYGSEQPKDFGDYIEKAECLELAAEILTRRGFKRHDELVVGEDVLTYDVASDACRWSPVRAVNVYRDQPVVRMSNRDFSVVQTPDHKWATAGAYQSWVTGEPPRRLREAHRLVSSDRIILSAPAPGGHSDLTPDEAAIIGWLLTDGTIWRANGSMRPMIYQSKQASVVRIRELVGASARESVGQPTTRTFPTGSTYDCLPQHVFHLPAGIVRAMLTKIGVGCYEDVAGVLHTLSQPARRAMLDSMMEADGDAKGNLGKTAKPGVQEVWQILCALEGIAVGMRRNADVFPVQRAKRRRYLSCSTLTTEDAGRADVWCPTTDDGTWVTRLPTGQITITGNTKAVGRALAALGYGTAAAFEEAPERIADSPVGPRQRAEPTRTPPRRQTRGDGPEIAPETAQRPVAGPGKMTEAQGRKLWAVAKAAGNDENGLRAEVTRRYGHESIRDLSKQEASALIDAYEKGGAGGEMAIDADYAVSGDAGDDAWTA